MINHVREAGIVKQLSVAVLVDGVSAGEGVRASYQPRTPEELDQIGALVRGAIGFDAERGDRVEVINMEFAPADLPAGRAGDALRDRPSNDLFRMAQSLFVLVCRHPCPAAGRPPRRQPRSRGGASTRRRRRGAGAARRRPRRWPRPPIPGGDDRRRPGRGPGEGIAPAAPSATSSKSTPTRASRSSAAGSTPKARRAQA